MDVFLKEKKISFRKSSREQAIIGISNKGIVLEIIGTERIDTIVADKGLIADEKYPKNLSRYSNRNLMRI